MSDLYMTKGVTDKAVDSTAFGLEIHIAITRFFKNDWGDLCEEDRKTNEEAIKNGGRVFAAYNTSQGKIYIINEDTKAEEKVITVLFANEY